MTATPEKLTDILDLERLEVDLFRGRSPHEHQQRVFGGQVAPHSLVAAGRTVPADRAVHSLHSYLPSPRGSRDSVPPHRLGCHDEWLSFATLATQQRWEHKADRKTPAA